MSSQVERSTCRECEHGKVCKYMEDYEEAGRQACHLDIKDPFKIVIACPCYSWSRKVSNLSGTSYSDPFTPPGACCKE